MQDQILGQITEVMRDLFDEYDGPITRDTSARDVPQWDSLAHVQLMVMVEQALRVKFTTGEIQGLSSLGDLIDLVERKKS